MVWALIQPYNQYSEVYRLGHGDYVFSFFSSISYHLEGIGHWGERFPQTLIGLCDHGIVMNDCFDAFSAELDIIERELSMIPVTSVIYDIGDLSIPAPWELLPGRENDNLAQPWVTPRSATSFFAIFKICIEKAKRRNTNLLLATPLEATSHLDLHTPRNKGRDFWIKDKTYN